MSTLENLLRMKVLSEDKDGYGVEVSPEFRVAVQEVTDDGVRVIVHAADRNSDTMDLLVSGNEITDLSEQDCPHAAPFRYCQTCPVNPCPVGLGDPPKENAHV